MISVDTITGVKETFDYDTVIIGAGISGIGVAARLKQKIPSIKILIVESREAVGGTWSFFTYPGVRTDSDIYTYGYGFKPYTGSESIVSGQTLLQYLHETIEDYDLEKNIRYEHTVTRLDWSTSQQLWTTTMTTPEGPKKVTSQYVQICCGYYDYKNPHRPTFAGEETFCGDIFHSQLWPKNFDATGKKIAVVGSGATAITVIPEIARTAEHVTMIQRTPSWIVAGQRKNKLSGKLSRFLSTKQIYWWLRQKNILFSTYSFRFLRRFPRLSSRLLLRHVRSQLPDLKDREKHFTPPYNPWDQRVCFDADGAFFTAIRKGDVSIETTTIKTMTETGLITEEERHIPVDTLILATGFDISVAGKIPIYIDKIQKDLSQCHIFGGCFFASIPNCLLIFGYTNSSWTLKVDLVSSFLVRLIEYMRSWNYTTVTVAAPENLEKGSIDFFPGYMKRSYDAFPQYSNQRPWNFEMSYVKDKSFFSSLTFREEFFTFS